MPTGLVRLITMQKDLKTYSVKGMKQHYLGSNHIHIDHAAIKYLMTKKDAKPRLIRWVLLL